MARKRLVMVTLDFDDGVFQNYNRYGLEDKSPYCSVFLYVFIKYAS